MNMGFCTDSTNGFYQHQILGPIIQDHDLQLTRLSKRSLRSIEKAATKDFLDWLAGEGIRLEIGHGHLEFRENEWKFKTTRAIPQLAFLIRCKWNQVGIAPDFFFFFHHTTMNRAAKVFAARQLTIQRVNRDKKYAIRKYATREEAHDKHVFFVEQLAKAVLILVQGWSWAE
ncbi:hypothetical protein M0657_003567 [Pyricularia oryzae]|nr:hypothetical protein M9X92_010208 [Pyricularia oryzae]KAI7926737.1 hypothetical protein M0657_003567 [Pyricularia oryzae]